MNTLAATNTIGRQASNAWRVLSLLFLANLLNVYDRLIPAVIVEPLRQEFQLTDLHIGLVGTAFTVIYAFAGVPLGRLADNGSRKVVIGWGLAIWSGFTALTGMASGFASFLLLRMGVGIGEASYAPAANSLISDLFQRNRRSLAVGLYMLGLPVGLVLGFFTVGAIATHFQSWRAPFFVAAIPGLLLAGVFFFVKEPARGSSELMNPLVVKPIAHPIRTVLSRKTMWWVILSGASYNFASNAANSFMVPLFQRYFHLDLKSAGLMTGVMLGLTGLIAMTAGGVLADKLQLRFRKGRLHLCTGGMVVGAVCTWLALQRNDVAAFAWLFGIGWLAAYLYAVCIYPVVQDLVVPQLRATAMSIFLGAMYLLGAAFGSVALGALSDYMARNSQLAEGAAVMSAIHRATGLHDAMILVPIALVVTAVACLMASRTYLEDVARVQEEIS